MNDKPISKGDLVMVGPANPMWKGGVTRSTKGYLLVLNHNHPRATADGYVFEHILIAERVLGRPLPREAVVHHADENRGRTNPHALVVCPNDNYHRLLHQRSRALDACGNADWRKCTICKQYDSLINLYFNAANANYLHRSCRNDRSKAYRQRRESVKDDVPTAEELTV